MHCKNTKSIVNLKLTLSDKKHFLCNTLCVDILVVKRASMCGCQKNVNVFNTKSISIVNVDVMPFRRNTRFLSHCANKNQKSLKNGFVFKNYIHKYIIAVSFQSSCTWLLENTDVLSGLNSQEITKIEIIVP